MKTEDTEALGRQRAKPSKTKDRYSRPTCKNCLYLCASLITVHNTVTVFFHIPFLQTNTTSINIITKQTKNECQLLSMWGNNEESTITEQIMKCVCHDHLLLNSKWSKIDSNFHVADTFHDLLTYCCCFVVTSHWQDFNYLLKSKIPDTFKRRTLL